jgi:hypothetical protein
MTEEATFAGSTFAARPRTLRASAHRMGSTAVAETAREELR